MTEVILKDWSDLGIWLGAVLVFLLFVYGLVGANRWFNK